MTPTPPTKRAAALGEGRVELHTLREQLAAMQDNTPNPRDFYVVGSGVDHAAYYAALDQHHAEMAAMRGRMEQVRGSL